MHAVISNLRNKKSPGSDMPRVTDLKVFKEKISPIIAKFNNLSVREGFFPECLKTSLVRPIYKSGDQREITNFYFTSY